MGNSVSKLRFWGNNNKNPNRNYTSEKLSKSIKSTVEIITSSLPQKKDYEGY